MKTELPKRFINRYCLNEQDQRNEGINVNERPIDWTVNCGRQFDSRPLRLAVPAGDLRVGESVSVSRPEGASRHSGCGHLRLSHLEVNLMEDHRVKSELGQHNFIR